MTFNQLAVLLINSNYKYSNKELSFLLFVRAAKLPLTKKQIIFLEILKSKNLRAVNLKVIDLKKQISMLLT